MPLNAHVYNVRNLYHVVAHISVYTTVLSDSRLLFPSYASLKVPGHALRMRTKYMT